MASTAVLPTTLLLRRWFCVLGMVALFSAGVGGSGRAADGPERFHAVNGWRGTLTASARPSQNSENLIRSTLAASGTAATLDYNIVQEFEFVLDSYESDPSVWRGRIRHSNYEAGYHFTAKNARSGDQEASFETSGPLKVADGDPVELQFHRDKGWSVRFPTANRPTNLRERWTNAERDYTARNTMTANSRAMGNTKTHPYPARGLILFATDEKAGNFPGVSGRFGVTPEVTWDYAIYLEPTSLEQLKVEIEEPAAYATWRPQTTVDRTAGPPLAVKARVMTESGREPKTQVERFIWELSGTSREPGVALNFPLGAKDQRFDLELDADGQFYVLSADKQRMERAVQRGFSDDVKIAPYDWGGWSTLQVTAVMTDGRRIKGKLQGKSEFGLRVPKRAADSHIADGWKAGRKAGADDLDDEKIAGQTDDGDGFTLYEEYRGWVVDGQHVEGDPAGKDFFVLNLIGADAEPGIDLFESVSQLRVHAKLRRGEMSETERLMNGNRVAGAHRVDQHGVWVKTFARSALGDDGAATALTAKGVAGRPGITKGVGILARDDTASVFNQPFNLPPQDAMGAFDRAIAHELLHAVGVEHHGAGDYRQILGYSSPRNPLNTLGRPYYGSSADTPVPLFDESGEDLAAKHYDDYVKFRKFTDLMMLDRSLDEGRQYIARNGVGYGGFNTPEQYADLQIELLIVFCFMHLDGVVGVEHGEHSGHQDCLMRYYFAKFYEAKNKPERTLYWVTPGTERIGMEICHAAAGTGINAPGFKPQSRYGDAGSGAGDCFAQICPNDAIPPRKVKP